MLRFFIHYLHCFNTLLQSISELIGESMMNSLSSFNGDYNTLASAKQVSGATSQIIWPPKTTAKSNEQNMNKQQTPDFVLTQFGI